MLYPRRAVLKLLPTAGLSLVLLPVFRQRADATGQERNFSVHLDNGQAIAAGEPVTTPPTNGEGEAILRLSSDGTELSFKLNVANIENVQAAHIHKGGAGAKGPIVAGMYGFPTVALIPGRSDGTLATGTIKATDLVDGLAGKQISDLVNLMTSGQAYVNVHTHQNPGGEIRGQIFLQP
jgi:CHRD domain